MFKNLFLFTIGSLFLISSLPIKSETLWNRSNKYLNHNQPYKNTGKEKEPFLNVEDNNDLWNIFIEIHNKKVGYEDIEFRNITNFCRYIAESVVLQKKIDFYLEHVVDYSTICMRTQTKMIKHFMNTDYHDENDIEVIKEDPKVGLK